LNHLKRSTLKFLRNSGETAFLEAVLHRGCRIQVGLDMLFEQISAYLDVSGFPVATPDELRALSNIRYDTKGPGC